MLNNIAKNMPFKALRWIIIYEMISVAIGYATRLGMHPWYDDLGKSAFTPPGYIFSIVWPLLYCTLAILGYRLYNKRSVSDEYSLVFKLYLSQMLLNWLWSPIFFNFHLTKLALFILVVIVIINIYLILKLIRSKNNDQYLILPYFMWICFALYLNIIIVLKN